MISSVGIMGYGAFGAFLETLIRRFAPQVEIRIHSSRFAPDGKRFFTLEETCASDALILAVPIHAFGEWLERILSYLGQHTIVIDVATVKMHTVGLLQKMLGERPYLATHPMFGPESYAKRAEDVSGFRIVITEHTLPEEQIERLSAFLRACGFTVIRMTSDEHDKRLASTLFLTHYIGQIVHRADFERTDIDTVSFGYLMDAVESVRQDRALFEDVYRFNPYCEETIKRFEAAEKDVHQSLPGQ